eukprot:2033708-Rhodomonas_salina.2
MQHWHWGEKRMPLKTRTGTRQAVVFMSRSKHDNRANKPFVVLFDNICAWRREEWKLKREF